MTTALHITATGPLVTLQDAGRRGYMRFGVPASGPLDRLAHAAANLTVGNDQSAPAIEVSGGGLTLELPSGAVTVAVTAGSFVLNRRRPIASWFVLTLRAGDRLTVRAGPSRNWAYVAVAGHLQTPTWLGSAATHAMSGLGGGVLRAPARLAIHDARVDRDREGEIPLPTRDRPAEEILAVIGPQDGYFDNHDVAQFCGGTFRVTDRFDRMGVRLQGRPIVPADALSIPSQPLVRGSVQVGGDGVPTVLLADHQTSGGYPKIATVVSTELDHLAQRRPGESIMFKALSPDLAVQHVRAEMVRRTAYLDTVSGPDRTLTHRLRHHNLIDGAVADDGDNPSRRI